MSPRDPYLFFYRCKFCGAGLTTTIHGDRRNCPTCYRWMSYIGSHLPETREEWEIVRRRETSAPMPDTTPVIPWTCCRCDREFSDVRPLYRTDGKACRECYAAERLPKQPRRSQEVEDEDYERMEAAYRAAEGR